MTVNLIAREEQLDIQDPLRHYMQLDDINETDPSETHQVSSELLSVLPRQSHSVHDEILKLSFLKNQDDLQPLVSITLSMDAAPGCGGVAWPAGQVLANYLVKKGPSFVTGRNVLELGSGTGLVGLVAGKLGGNVWITDQAPLLGIMHRNVLGNKLESTVTVSELNWSALSPLFDHSNASVPYLGYYPSRGSLVSSNIPSPDLILAADCVYFEPAFPLLVQTLSELVGDTTEVLFCYKKRRKADKRFFTILRKKFSWIEVSDDPHRHIYGQDSITLIRLFKTKTNGVSGNRAQQAEIRDRCSSRMSS
ncbi:putative methyltransferase-domain-containing protein [Collybia nuda]|uniref:Protein-lysine N-methyltransferase EFM6 n=1 Tax=Collybia nuda TaxID=64659 RepID=A0A9P5YHT6_9AGAR|nr:putative methyltransferase-domain-containing protein [Collybia nuda]